MKWESIISGAFIIDNDWIDLCNSDLTGNFKTFIYSFTETVLLNI